MRWNLRKGTRFLAVSLAVLVAAACEQDQLTGPPEAMTASQQTIGSEAGSLGNVTLDAEVGWLVGSGQFDGEFITAEAQGVVIGLRAQQREAGLLGVTGDRGNRVAVYEAETGGPGGNIGTWNYDWHVDLSGARGRHAGRTLADYKLALEQDFTEQNLFEALGHDPVVLALDGVHACTNNYGPDTAPGTVGVDLCEQSWNPGFGNDSDRDEEGAAYNPEEERTYNLRLVLTPETFNAEPLAVAIRVNVTNP